MVVLIPPGHFSAVRLVPPALVALATDAPEEVCQTRVFEPTASWIVGLEIPAGVEPKDKRWYGYNGEVVTASSETVNAVSEATSSPEEAEYLQEGDAIPLTACGKIWRDHGKDIINKIQAQAGLAPLNETSLLKAHRKIYESTIQSLDARTLGIKRCDQCSAGMFDSWTSFDKMLTCIDPWTVDGVSNSAESLKARHAALQQAVAETAEILRKNIKGILTEWIPAVTIVQKAFDNRDQYKQGDQFVLVLEHFAPWREHLYNIEDETNVTEEADQVKWVLFHDDRSGQWRATAPAKRGERFANRALLHEDLRGLRDDELVAKSGIEGASFVHHSGFTGGAASLESMLKLISYGH